MEKIRFERDERRNGAPPTRLYAPTRDSGAYAYDPETGEKLKAAPLKATPVALRPRTEMKLSSRIGIMFCAFVFAGMLVFVLSGYERISRAYAQINTLNDSIEEIQLHINALEADSECAVTLEDAQQYAESHGMRYPVQSQYLQSGSPIPITGSTTPSGDAPDGTTPDGEDPAGQTPDEDTPAVP